MKSVYIIKYIKQCVILPKSRCSIKIANPNFVTISNYETSIYMLNYTYKDSSYNMELFTVLKDLCFTWLICILVRGPSIEHDNVKIGFSILWSGPIEMHLKVTV